MIDKCIIEEVTNPDESLPIIQLMNRSLGKNYINNEEIQGYILSNNAALYKASYNKQLVGARIVKQLNKAEHSSAFLPEQINTDISQLVSVVVEPNFRHRHIGEAMFDAGLHWARKHSNYCFTVSWQTKNMDKRDAFLKAKGFSLYKSIPKFWYDDSLKLLYSCPVCGAPPCSCTAKIYINKNL